MNVVLVKNAEQVIDILAVSAALKISRAKFIRLSIVFECLLMGVQRITKIAQAEVQFAEFVLV